MFKKAVNEIINGRKRINTLSPTEEQGRLAGGRGNVEASLIAGRNPGAGRESTSKVTKEVEQLLEEAAKSGQYSFRWFTSKEIDSWILLDQGMESRVYVKNDLGRILKVMYNCNLPLASHIQN